MHIETKVVLNLFQLVIKSRDSGVRLHGYESRALHIPAIGSGTLVSSSLTCDIETMVELDPYDCVYV